MPKNITLSADEELIRKAREKALREKSSLNQRFREWLIRYVRTGQPTSSFTELMDELSYAQPGKHFSREELNER